MKTIEINLYKFNELSEDAKNKAIENLRDINVDYEWYDSTYEDAKNIGLRITGFDLDRDRHATGEFEQGGAEVAHAILKEHGETCNTYKLAKEFLSDYDALVEKYSDGKKLNIVTEENVYDFDNEADDLEQDFKKSLLEEYSVMLQNECDYLQSDEAVKESIEANEYDFTENGRISITAQTTL